MKTDESNSDAGVSCYVCGATVNGSWFARFLQGDSRVCACKPRCAMLYAEAPVPFGVHDSVQYYRIQKAQIDAAKAQLGQLCDYDDYLSMQKV